MTESSKTYDFVIVGSGFGGSISAMRLAQKGYSVAVLEMGKEYQNSEFPKTNWDVRKYLWLPFLRCFGIQKISLVNKIMALHGIGVGGGSLVYANTLLTPEDYIFQPLHRGIFPLVYSRQRYQHHNYFLQVLHIDLNDKLR